MVSPAFTAGEALSAAKLQLLAGYDTWTPEISTSGSAVNYGSSPVQDGKIWTSGQRVDLFGSIVFGSGLSAGSGLWYFDLPSSYPVASGWYDLMCGTARLIDAGNTEGAGLIYLDVANQRFVIVDVTNSVQLGATYPWAWAVDDAIHFHLTYLIDAA